MQNKFNKEQKSDKAKIDKLLKTSVSLEQYEEAFGPLPPSLRPRDSIDDILDEEDSEESPLQSDGESHKPDDSELEEAKKPTIMQSKVPEPNLEDLNFFSNGR